MPKFRLLFMLGLSLALPWSGCEYIHQKEQLMRSAESDKLLHQAQKLAITIEPLLHQKSDTATSVSGSQSLYLYRLPEKIQLDGYHDDWGIEIDISMEYRNRLAMSQVSNQNLVAMAGYNSSYLYLFFQVFDDNVIYFSPQHTELPSDQIVLDITGHNLAGRYFLQVTAPGNFDGLRKTLDELDNIELNQTTDIQGYWQDTAYGYNVELRLARPEAETQLGFSVYDYDIVAQNQIKLMGQYGNQPPDLASTAVLIRRSSTLQNFLDQSQTTATQVYIINPDGWILASKYTNPSIKTSANRSHINQTLYDILSQLYIFVSNLKDSNSPAPTITSSTGRISGKTIETSARNIITSSWYKQQGSNQPMMSITYPINNSHETLAIIVIEQSSSVFLSLQNPDFLRNIAYSLLMIIILSLLMFIYTWKLARQILHTQAHGKNQGGMGADQD